MKNIFNKKTVCIVLAASVLLSACMGRELTRVSPRTESYVTDELPPVNTNGVDILVVVDNSGSMAAEQAMLRDAFPSLISSILDPPLDPATGRRIHAPVRDLHLGVVSTDMGVGGYDVQTCDEPTFGDDGVLQHLPRGTDCSSAYPTFLSYKVDENAEPDLPAADALARDFGCIAVLGTQGCGFEQQLEAARKALLVHGQPGGANAGFLREGTILTILFVTDEEDCSAEDDTIFDVETLPYSVNLQCNYQKDKLFSIDRYYNDLKSLRANPDHIIVGFIVGVPPGSECEGRGNELEGCTMPEIINGEGTMLEYICKYPEDCTPSNPPDSGNCTSEAFPGNRFVELAQQFGDNAVVHSICTDTFEPAVEALSDKLREALGETQFRRRLHVEKDPEDPTGCRCVANCDIIETLTDNRPCESLGNPAKATYRDENGNPVVSMDEETGQAHTLCLIQQAGAVIEDCGRECDDPFVVYSRDATRSGWWYDPSQDIDGDGDNDYRVIFPPDARPESGSGVNLQCSSVVCPSERQCGPAAARGAACCNVSEYCYDPPGGDGTSAGLCLLRRDVCEEHGEDAWCPAADPLPGDPMTSGLCCVDPDMDGKLDLFDEDGDGLDDTSIFMCNAAACVPR
ncbi:MAG: hypothetical protein ABIJ56_06705 [Pseudomonadota bacterium]